MHGQDKEQDTVRQNLESNSKLVKHSAAVPSMSAWRRVAMTQELSNPLELSGVGSGETDGAWMSFVKKGKGGSSATEGLRSSKDSLKGHLTNYSPAK
jgi:hypothetical protein